MEMVPKLKLSSSETKVSPLGKLAPAPVGATAAEFCFAGAPSQTRPPKTTTAVIRPNIFFLFIDLIGVKCWIGKKHKKPAPNKPGGRAANLVALGMKNASGKKFGQRRNRSVCLLGQKTVADGERRRTKQSSASS